MATKTGTSGNDTLYGGGPDTLIGLAGDDTYAVYSSADTVVEEANQGNDTVLTFASYALAPNSSVENLSTAINSGTDPIALTGNALAQVIVGNYGMNTLDGGGGSNALVGLRGDDTYRVQRTDFVVEAAGEGSDLVLALGDFILNAGSSVETISAVDRLSTTGLLLGGNELAQTIYGAAGADTLNGGGGGDFLAGGAGDDVYRVFGDERFGEVAGEGNDTVFTSGSIRLDLDGRTPSIELLSAAVQAGTDPISLVGNGNAQTIIGNYGDNNIDGNGRTNPVAPFGSDTLIGLRGNDTYTVYDARDVVVENAGEGNDAVYLSPTLLSYRLQAGASVELLSTSLNAAMFATSLFGNEVAQTIVANYGDNLIDGGAGNDTLYGLAGNDVFRFSTALGPTNVDTIADYGTGNDRIQLDSSIFTGLSAGTVAASAIAYGAAAADADDRIVYNPQTGALSYDADGSGSGAAIQFATLSANLAASALQLSVAAPQDATTVSITGSGTFLVGNAAGTGTSLASAYPGATSFLFGRTDGIVGEQQNLIFGPDSVAAGAPTIRFVNATSAGTFDFSQLTTGVVIRAGSSFQTSDGRTILASPPLFQGEAATPRQIFGTAQADLIDGTARYSAFGPDQGLHGGGGNDTLIGGGNLYGDAGNDRLVGIVQSQMYGGDGQDSFVMRIYVAGAGGIARPNAALDFDPGQDRIEISLNIASDLPLGPLDASRFGLGATATTADQRILYDPETGYLRYDANGSAPDTVGQLQIFGYVPAHLDITPALFTVGLP